MIRIATSEDSIGGIYNVCDGLDVSWRRYMDDLAGILSVAPPPSVPAEPLFAAARANEDPAARVGPRQEGVPPLELLNLVGSDNRFDTQRIRALGWSPRVSYEQALAEIATHLKGQ